MGYSCLGIALESRRQAKWRALLLPFDLSIIATTNNSAAPSIAPSLARPIDHDHYQSHTNSKHHRMSAQSDNQHMEGVQDPATDVKGKGKASEADVMEESDDSSDESGIEDQVCSCV